MKLTRSRIILFITAFAVIALSSVFAPPSAYAHPLGNFTVNQFSEIRVESESVFIRYIVDMAEIPAFQELSNIDLDGDGEVSNRENQAYLATSINDLLVGLSLEIDGSPVILRVTDSKLAFPPGLGGLQTLRLELGIEGDANFSTSSSHELVYRMDNFTNDLGWREIIVKPTASVNIIQSNALEASKTDELRNYPNDLLSTPLDLREAQFTFALTGIDEVTSQPPTDPRLEESTEQSDDLLTSLITVDQLSLPIIVIAIAVALGLGALHAASPGHGKTIMAAYLVGTQGNAVHALFLGFTVTISHTLGVIGLGLVVLFASNIIEPERLYPWLGLASGLVIIAIGAILLAGRIRDRLEFSNTHAHAEDGSIIPSTLQESEKSSFSRIISRLETIGTKVFHGHTHDEDHHHHGHTHGTANSGGSLKLTWKNLTALGIVGGLVPSASALIILIASITLQRVVFGLLLILAFSVGMAAVLSGIGLLIVYAGRVFERVSTPSRLTRTFTRLLPTATAIIVLLSGLFVALRSIFQLGLI